MLKRRTRAPVATTTPAPSVPSTSGNLGRPPGHQEPSRTCVSHTPTPAPARAMSTWRGPGSGTGRLRSVRARGGPNRPMAAAFIFGSALVRFMTDRPAACGLGCILLGVSPADALPTVEYPGRPSGAFSTRDRAGEGEAGRERNHTSSPITPHG